MEQLLYIKYIFKMHLLHFLVIILSDNRVLHFIHLDIMATQGTY